MKNKKHVFIDMDGTITSFENDRGKVVTRVDEFTKKFFITREPLWDMIFNIKLLFPKDEWEYHILSNSPSPECTEGKNIWLDKYFDIEKENRHFIEYNKEYTRPKSNVIVDWCFENDVELKDVAFIDDTYENLKQVETLNIDSWHPSKVLCKSRNIRFK